MTEETLRLKTNASDDKQHVELTFLVNGEAAWHFQALTKDVDSIITALDQSRRILEPPVADPKPDIVYSISAFNPGWMIRPDSENRFAVLWLRHPGLGWQLYGFPRHEAGEISKWLRKIPSYTTTEERIKAFPPEATSFGGDKFLMTTHGLEFYYFGEGTTRIEFDPFDQVEYDSDRAAGIVAGAIAERRLEEALKSIMRTDNPDSMEKVTNFLFNPSSALGSFRAKIDLAFALNVLSIDAYKDLSNMKNIRNDFAHRLELDTFDAPSIKDRCKNFILVDKHIGPAPEMPSPEEIENGSFNSVKDRPTPYMGYPDHEKRLADPRFRYVMTSQLISHSLGLASSDKSKTLPMF